MASVMSRTPLSSTSALFWQARSFSPVKRKPRRKAASLRSALPSVFASPLSVEKTWASRTASSGFGSPFDEVRTFHFLSVPVEERDRDGAGLGRLQDPGAARAGPGADPFESVVSAVEVEIPGEHPGGERRHPRRSLR
jgi:hypothetical protein